MTVLQLSEIVSTLLGYNSTERPTDDRDVFFVADQIRGTLIEQYIAKEGSTVIPQFCYPMLLPIQYDTVRARKYIDLGTQVIGLQNNAGIVQIGLPQEEETSFVMTQAGMTSVTSSMEVGKALNRYKCWIEGTRIYFFYLDAAFENILVKAIPSLFAKKPDGTKLIDWDDQLPQPFSFNNYLMENARSAFMLQKATMQDKTNDQSVTPTAIS